MLGSRSGHCEYFAAATVLLLKTLGIPARYATGYSVHEYSDLEKAFVVRQRHAHAWTLVYLNGSWQDFDTTPASWIAVEEEAASKWAGLPDLWSWFVYTLSKWRWSERSGGAARYIFGILFNRGKTRGDGFCPTPGGDPFEFDCKNRGESAPGCFY